MSAGKAGEVQRLVDKDSTKKNESISKVHISKAHRGRMEDAVGEHKAHFLGGEQWGRRLCRTTAGSYQF